MFLNLSFGSLVQQMEPNKGGSGERVDNNERCRGVDWVMLTKR